MDLKQIKIFRQLISDWYQQNKRALPWRDTNDPYRIWLSEIILQQTRVNQGMDYYLRFIDQFPNVNSLANADEDVVLKLWQGLGYYTRARNLHKTARIISREYNGVFPMNFKEIIALPGIGDYTASAISSIAFGEAHAVVDGNVYRVLARLTGDATPIDTGTGQRHFKELAQTLLSEKSAGEHNQAMMEFGALQCVPTNPDCENCPLNTLCLARKMNSVELLPVKQGKTKVRKRYFNYFFIEHQDYCYIKQRTEQDIWKKLYEFPLIETEQELQSEELLKTEAFKLLFGKRSVHLSSDFVKRKHVLSHQQIFARLYRLHIESESDDLEGFIKISPTELSQYPVSRLTELLLEYLI